MATPVGNHGLTCLDGSDPAAIALWMQENAQTIDSNLATDQTNFTDYLNRPWYVAVNTSAITVNNLSGFVLPEGQVGEVAPSSGSWNTTSNDVPNPSLNTRIPAGFWLMGSTVNWTVATPNNGTARTLGVFDVKQPASGSASIVTNYDVLFQSVDRESSTGGGTMSVTGFFSSTGSDTRQVVAEFFHSNTSSDLVIPIGGWRLWYVRMGSGLVI
jgi:hypothetical protein